MVHALKEARRVLKPHGILIDLRPAPAHRQLGIGEGRSWRRVGELHEVLDDDYAADAAVAHLVDEGLLREQECARFLLDRVMDNLQDVREFLADFDQRRDLPPHTDLLEKAGHIADQKHRPHKFTVRGPMHLAILRKTEPTHIKDQTGGAMILAIVSDPSKTETLLNNLSEADFNLDDVSVIMKDVAQRDKIAKDAGMFKGVQAAQLAAAMSKAGIPSDKVQRCTDALDHGKPVVAMKVDPKYESAARQMFQDMSAELL